MAKAPFACPNPMRTREAMSRLCILAPGWNFSDSLAYCPRDRGMSSSFHCGFVLGEAVQFRDEAWLWNQSLSVPK